MRLSRLQWDNSDNPPIVDAMLIHLTEHFGNPSSSHHFGQEPKRAVNKARQSLLLLIQNSSDLTDSLSFILFTGCGTEVNDLAIWLSILGADMVTVLGHKFGAPKGIAALYMRPTCFDENGGTNPDGGGSVLFIGGGQEGERRGGTENVPYIAGMGRAAA